MLQEIRVWALGAVEEVFFLALFAFGGAGVGVGVGDFGGFAVAADQEAVECGYYGGEGGGGEDVANWEEGVSLGSW